MEVDFVIYGSAGFWAIEVKNSAAVRSDDVRALRTFVTDYPSCEPLLLYRGADRLVELPVPHKRADQARPVRQVEEELALDRVVADSLVERVDSLVVARVAEVVAGRAGGGGAEHGGRLVGQLHHGGGLLRDDLVPPTIPVRRLARVDHQERDLAGEIGLRDDDLVLPDDHLPQLRVELFVCDR